jgi:hypothetical protein
MMSLKSHQGREEKQEKCKEGFTLILLHVFSTKHIKQRSFMHNQQAIKRILVRERAWADPKTLLLIPFIALQAVGTRK